MKPSAPLCARGRVRALRGLPRARWVSAASAAPSRRSAAQPPGRPRGRGGGSRAGSGPAGGPRDGVGRGDVRAPARRSHSPSMLRRWRPPPACELRVPR